MEKSRRKKRRKPKWLKWLILAIAGMAMVGVWIYGFWQSTQIGLIALPVGVGVFICTVGASFYPLITALAIIVGALLGVDGGVLNMLKRAAIAFAAVGAGSMAVHGIQLMVRRGWLKQPD